jgi:pSer/pThr/pTyr-binding forkhead associated (FHA) protein
VGRTADTDVMINDFSVSKLHAKISIDPILNQYSLVDCGSTNGTSVEEVALTPETPYPIRSKMRIGFGRLCFEILSPRDLFAYLTDRAEGPTSLDIPAIKDD